MAPGHITPEKLWRMGSSSKGDWGMAADVGRKLRPCVVWDTSGGECFKKEVFNNLESNLVICFKMMCQVRWGQ